MGRLLRCSSPIHDQDSRTNSKRTVLQSWSYYYCFVSSSIQRSVHYWHARSSSPHRWISSSYAWGATRYFHTSVCSCAWSEIKPKAYCSQRCHPPAKAWWWHLVTLVYLVWARIWRAQFLLFSSLALIFFDAIAFWNIGVPSFQYSFLPYFSSLLLLFLLFFS